MPGAFGPEEARRVAEAALDLPGADGVEVLVMHEWGGLTRFADSRIHQSTWLEDIAVRIRVVRAGRIAVAATNAFSPEGARAAARSALEMASVVSPDPLFPGLAPPQPVPEAPELDEATAACTPEQRAEGVAELIARCGRGLSAAGAFETLASEVALANSQGQFCWAPLTRASLSTVVTGPDGGSGFAESIACRVDEIDPADVGGRAADKAERSRSPAPIQPGRYTVVLEPAAVATLVGFLGWLGFGGREYVEGRSCLSGRAGERVTAPQVSIYDDGASPETIGLPFDFEGTPKRRVDLIERGVFRDAVYDRRTARQAGTESTGHALPPPNPEGPFPLNLFLAPGEASLEAMIAATERGLLVTRFHYTNVVHPTRSVITGMTRDGTFLIERGEIARPVRNLRFTQSILEALERTVAIGRETELASEFFLSASRVPALQIEGFAFTGASDH